jgi:Raf kinase inhibitor-like YbhB/YbcL family protein
MPGGGSGGSTVTAGTGGGGGGGGGVAAGSGGGGGTGGGASSGGGASGGSGGLMPFVLTSPAFEHSDECSTDNLDACNVFPQENLLDTFMNGGNVSPELDWGPGPNGTMSYAIVLHDYSNGFTHWAMWNIAGTVTQLPENLPRETNPSMPAGSQQVSFDQDDGYQGPGAAAHVYEFRLYALSTATFSPDNPGDQGAVRSDLESGADGAVLGTTDLRGRSTP